LETVSARESVVYVLPAKMGGVVTNLSNLQAACDRERFAQYTILTHNQLDRDTPFEGSMASDEQTRFEHALPLENLHSVLRRFGKAVPAGAGVLVSSDWLELAWAGAHRTEKAVIQILHGDFDYYYELAQKHEEIVDVFITCSRWIHDKLVKLLPSRIPSIHYIPYGVPISGLARRQSNGPLRLLYAGRLERRQKRVFDLPSIDRALRARKTEVEWTIAGGGPDEADLRQRWEDGHRLRWAGVLSNRETIGLMADHDVYVLPSEAEGLPLALLEAMSVGLVPVVSDIPSGVPEVVVPGETGSRIPIGDVEGFAQAIAKLDSDRSILESMSGAARQLVADKFDVKLQAARYQELYAAWPKLKRPRQKRATLPYGSRLDRPWIPNSIVRFIRERSRPELGLLLRSSPNVRRG
jgi:glycosyltransferase involved in cell wall biosynthesis